MTDTPASSGAFNRILNAIERVGNKLPNPFMLFIYLALIVIVASWLMSMAGASVIHPGKGEVVPIQNLASGEGVQYMLTSLLTNFTAGPRSAWCWQG